MERTCVKTEMYGYRILEHRSRTQLVHSGSRGRKTSDEGMTCTPRLCVSIPCNRTRFRVLWNAPPADGGSPITKYKIEWDPDENFSSGANGGPLGSHHKVVTNSSQCSSSPCEYSVPSLAKGVPYHVRVFSYNQVSNLDWKYEAGFYDRRVLR